MISKSAPFLDIKIIRAAEERPLVLAQHDAAHTVLVPGLGRNARALAHVELLDRAVIGAAEERPLVLAQHDAEHTGRVTGNSF